MDEMFIVCDEPDRCKRCKFDKMDAECLRHSCQKPDVDRTGYYPKDELFDHLDDATWAIERAVEQVGSPLLKQKLLMIRDLIKSRD